MLKKNIKPVLLAGALALATAVSPVMATTTDGYETTEDGTTKTYIQGTTVTLTKNFTKEDAVTSAINETFTYTISTEAPHAPSVSIGNQGTTATLNFGNSDVQKTLPIVFDASSPFTANDTVLPGNYIYTLTESYTGSSNVTAEGATSYTIEVRVVNQYPNVPGNLVVDQITVIKTDDENRVKTTPVFLNHYNEYDDLKIVKNVTGQGANVADAFDFEIEITLPATYYGTTNLTKDFTVIGSGEQTVINDTTNQISFTTQTITLTGTMTDDDYVVIAGLPVGTTYKVSEKDTEYDESVSVSTNNGALLTSENMTVGGKTVDSWYVNGTVINAGVSDDDQESNLQNVVTFTNDKPSDDIGTGVIINNMPYIALLGASGAGLVVLAASKKRSK